MDDASLTQLETAFDATPANGALLAVLLRACRERNETARGLALLAKLAGRPTPELARLGAELHLDAKDPEAALALLDGDEPATRVMRARVLARLERVDDARREYDAAIAAAPGLEDRDFRRTLEDGRNEPVKLPTGRPRLRVVSNDDTDESEVERLLAPPAQPVRFADIGGLDEIKATIHRKIILPFQKPSLFQRFRKRAGGGILLYGPPGCGKTLLARATAGECNAKFMSVQISDVLDMYTGESERKLHELFEQARRNAPAVLFFDEVEALGGQRTHTREITSSKLVSQFLSEMDGFAQDNQGVLILAATNVPWSVDPAFRRPGRFDRVLFVPPPDRPARLAILKQLLDERPAVRGIDVEAIAKRTGGFSGADLRDLVETAADEAIAESIASGDEHPITAAHLNDALVAARPTTLEWLTTARNYARYANEGGQYDEVVRFLERHGRDRA
ncbi:MAG TPA: AAA family ATPase [Xanthomonadales bacterium]|nr:AAA family ATPase [Xanthomonadales bacterium]